MTATKRYRETLLDPLIEKLNAHGLELTLEGPFKDNSPQWEYRVLQRGEQVKLPGWGSGRREDAKSSNWETMLAFLRGIENAINWMGPEVWDEVTRSEES